MNLSAFHSIGLWLAVTASPPAAPCSSTASCTLGVGTIPTSTTSHPTDCSAAVAARTNIGPETRESRPITTVRPGPCAARVRPEGRREVRDHLRREPLPHPPPHARDADHQLRRVDHLSPCVRLSLVPPRRSRVRMCAPDRAATLSGPRPRARAGPRLPAGPRAGKLRASRAHPFLAERTPPWTSLSAGIFREAAPPPPRPPRRGPRRRRRHLRRAPRRRRAARGAPAGSSASPAGAWGCCSPTPPSSPWRLMAPAAGRVQRAPAQPHELARARRRSTSGRRRHASCSPPTPLLGLLPARLPRAPRGRPPRLPAARDRAGDAE